MSDILLEQFSGTIWAMERSALEEMRLFIETSDAGRLRDRAVEASTRNRDALVRSDDEEDRFKSMYDQKENVALVPVRGKIFPRASMMQSLSGGVSVQDLTDLMVHLEEKDDINKVIMMVDSPGGRDGGLTNFSQTVRDMETETVAFAEKSMFSAAYWIGSSADRVYASPNAEVGSIGAFLVLSSQSERLKEKGVSTVVIRSTPKKALGHPSEPISEEAVEEYERRVKRVHDLFAEQVSLNRGIPYDTVQNTMANARIEAGEDAVDAGFLDGVKTRRELLQEEFSLSDSGETETEQAFAFLSEQYDEVVAKVDQAQGVITTLREENQRLREQLDDQKSGQITAMVDQAIEEDQKFHPGKREMLEKELSENFESTKRMIEMTPKGAAAPSKSLDTPNDQKTNLEEEEEIVSKIKATPGVHLTSIDNDGRIEAFEDMNLVEGRDFFVEEKIAGGEYDLSRFKS